MADTKTYFKQPDKRFFYDFHQLVEDANSYFRDGEDTLTVVPSLESDYALVISHNLIGSNQRTKAGRDIGYTTYNTSTITGNNGFRTEKILVQSINNAFFNNGIKAEKTFIGLNSYSFDFQQNFSITYIARPYLYAEEQQYTSYIHFLYKRQLSVYGTLRLKTSSFILPTILLFNIRTKKPVMLFKQCKFSYPKFIINPQSNKFVAYDTTIWFNDYDEFMDDGFELKESPALQQVQVNDITEGDYTSDISKSNSNYIWHGSI